MNVNIKNILGTIALSSMLMASCSQQELEAPISSNEATIAIASASVAELSTRVITEGQLIGSVDETVFMSVWVEGTTDTYTANNVEWFHHGTTWYSQSTIPYEGPYKQSICALSPYVADASDSGVTITADGVTDYLVASETLIDKNPVNIAMQHALTKLVLKPTFGSAASGEAIASVEVQNMMASGTLNVRTNSWSNREGTTALAMTGYEVLVIPMEGCASFPMVITMESGRVFKTTINCPVICTDDAGEEVRGLAAGTRYTISLQVGRDAVTVGNMSVSPWIDEAEAIEGIAQHMPPYITFTAEKENALTIKTSTTYTLDESIEYSINDGEWAQVIANTPMEFGGAKGTLRLRGKSATGMADGINIYARMVFDNNNPVACSGDIRTLVDYENYATADTKDARFYGMFTYCSNLTEAPKLPATELADYCYSYMFYQCTSLTQAPELPATTMADSCYNHMFSGCTALTQAPELPATTLAHSCYSFMFYGNTNLTQAPKLPATTLTPECYLSMLEGCSSLVQAPELPATTLADSCYKYMFYGCTSLTTGPSIIPATTMSDYCCQGMFIDCINLKAAPELPATTLASHCYNAMFDGCTSLTNVQSTLPATTLADNCYINMFRDCKSLAESPELPATTLAKNCYKLMFCGSGLVKAPKLPATVMMEGCYFDMFRDCASLTEAPELPATTMVNGCYTGMFMGSDIVKAPKLPATTLAKECYSSMFYGCKSLTDAPELPATTLTDQCYMNMFYGCKSLTEAPVLPATTLAARSYLFMFGNCENLNSVTMLATDVSATDCLNYWLYGVSATGTFTKAAEMASLPVGASGIPEGWTVVDYQ